MKETFKSIGFGMFFAITVVSQIVLIVLTIWMSQASMWIPSVLGLLVFLLVTYSFYKLLWKRNAKSKNMSLANGV